jgi:hypothetical protein
MYSNLSGTAISTSPRDSIGGGTLSGGVFTPPTNAGNTGVNTTPPSGNVYSGTRDNATITNPISETVAPPTPPTPPTFTLEPDDYGTRPPRPTTPPAPIIPIIVTPTPIITGGGYGGGGGGAISERPKVVAEKPNFIKKNILPILLVGSAIYVIIKKPI